jgi:hypothetical protein
VWKDLHWWQDASAARRDPEESDSERACKSCFHLQQMLETGMGAWQPWPGGGFTEVRNRGERGDGDLEEDNEKWRRCEKWLGLTAGSLFNSGGSVGHATVHWIAPKIMYQWSDLP